MADASHPTANGEPDPLEAEKLALERSKLRTERQKLALEVRLKRRELGDRADKTWKELFANPLTLAIAGGVLTILTTLVTTSFTAKYNRDAEGLRADIAQKSAKQALQAELIKKFVEATKTETVRENLRFLVDAGLLPDYATGITSYLDNNPNSAPAISSLVGGIVGPTDQRIALDKIAQLDRSKFAGVGIIRSGETSICSGFMVAPKIVISALHCFPGAKPGVQSAIQRLTFEAAPILPSLAFGTAQLEIDTSRLVILNREPDPGGFSVALAPLKDASISLPYLVLDPAPPVPLTHLETAFFAADRNSWVYSTGTDCQAVAVESQELRHLCDTGNGSSGAPLMSPSGKVVAVHMGRGSESKRALRADIIRNDPGVIRQFGNLPTAAAN